MNIKEYISSGILEAYVLGQCSAAEKAEVEALAEKNPEVREEILAIQETLGNYALLEERTPPPFLKERIASALKKEMQEEKKEPKVISMTLEKEVVGQKGGRFYKFLSAAAVALLIFSSAVIYSLYSKVNGLENEKNVLVGELELQKINYTDLSNSLAVMKTDLAILKNPDIVPMQMKGKDPAPDAKAMVYMDKSSNQIFLEVNKLPKAPEGMQYQFWAIIDGKPVDAGMIELCEQPDTCGIHPMKTIANAHAFAISLEKKGGSPAPQGEIFATYGI